jgi:hemerythrin superfamily protein
MNAITLLKQDHKNVEALFKRYEQLAEEATPLEKREIVDKLIEQLSVHAVIEEEIFYPAISAKSEETRSLLFEALEEHHVAKVALNELEKLQPVHERYDAKVHVLFESIRHHVKEEEGELFPQVRELFTVEELNTLGEQMETRKETAPTRPHPMAPDQAPLNLILNTPVAVLDKVITTGRDAVNKFILRRAS